MATTYKTFRNLYRDSVSLMQLSSRLSRMTGVEQASAVMASAANLALLGEAGLLQFAIEANPNELLVVIKGDDGAVGEAMAAAEAEFVRTARREAGDDGFSRAVPRSVEMALEDFADANLALISTPGEYAYAEALKALRLGLNVMMFSDDVDLADEIALKTAARERGLMVMGPDCGSAIINGVPLAFANVVARGEIGILAASGTGLQHVACLVDRWGLGISQAIGTGGRDLHQDVGGITMVQGLEVLAADPGTKVIVLVSKPPAPDVAARVVGKAKETGKPVVVNFLGVGAETIKGDSIHAARSLDEAAAMAVALAQGKKPLRRRRSLSVKQKKAVAAEADRLAPGQRYVRGLYSGGTFCYEALLLLADRLGPVHSSTPLDPRFRLADAWKSERHTVVDLGDDLFTRGRPHPMIDCRLRNERIVQEAADPETAVILLDVVLGYGAHADPAGEIASAIAEGRDLAARDGRHVVFVAAVCGTAADPQNLNRQEAALGKADVILAESNAEAVRLAAATVTERHP